jgi:hypothetical protein
MDLWIPSRRTGKGEFVRRIELCAICDRPGCGATVIICRVGSDKKLFDAETISIEMICPACDKPFALSITEMERFSVSDEQLQIGFFGGRGAACPHGDGATAKANARPTTPA